MELILFIVALAATAIAAYTDIRTREVPDWLNYGLIAGGLGLNGVLSLYHWRWEYIVASLLGLGVLFCLAYVMFYSGQWGGGDSKYIMGIGALFGLRLSLEDFTIAFVINAFVVGAAYGLVWSAALAVRHRHAFLAAWHGLRRSASFSLARVALLILAAMGILAGFLIDDLPLRLGMFAILFLLMLLFYTFIFTKAVEQACLQRWVKPEELTEGDWVVNDVVVEGKRVCGPKDLGVSKEQMAELVRLQRRGKVKTVLMKVGIQFMPSFLIALVITWFFGNLFLPVIGLIK